MPERIKIDNWSVKASPVIMSCQGHDIASATCFFWKSSDDIYLVSNWHVFSGREPVTGQPKNRDGAVPDKLTIKYYAADLASRTLQVSLYDDHGQPHWVQHAKGQAIDIAAIRVTDIFSHHAVLDKKDISPTCINSGEITRHSSLPLAAEGPVKLASAVGQDVFILGFPLGLSSEDHLPIWKRGSIASDYDIDYSGAPCFLVDTATREGMSGAPVVLRSIGTAVTEDDHVIMGGVFTQFIGIYSGRKVRAESEAQLGVVWKQIVIEEIVAGGVRGSFVLI